MADAGRVIAGTARGIRLATPGEGTRPLGDRVKQTLFAVLEPDLVDARVLDLFAGSGAAGIEALSRGAREATFVERDPGAARVITANLARTGFAGRGVVARVDVLAWLRSAARDPGKRPDHPASREPVATDPPASPASLHQADLFAVAIVDPPYGQLELLETVMAALGPLLLPGARVVAKHFWRDRPPAVIGLLASERERRFGETALTFYRRQEQR